MPMILLPPSVLFSDERYTIWHAGLVFGPPGFAVLTLEVTSPEPGAFRGDEWNLGGRPPIDVHIELPGPDVVAGSFSQFREGYAFHYQQWFPGPSSSARSGFRPLDPATLVGAKLLIQVHPLARTFSLPLSG